MDANRTWTAQQAAQQPPKLQFKLLHPSAHLPARSTEGAAGVDIFAFLITGSGKPSKMMVPTRSVRAIPTGLAIHPPSNHVTMICSRSGMAKDRAVFVANAPGIIDPDYTGELLILLYNGGHEPYYVEHNHRIAQILVVPATPHGLEIVTEFPSTSRGASGFGSTGL